MYQHGFSLPLFTRPLPLNNRRSGPSTSLSTGIYLHQTLFRFVNRHQQCPRFIHTFLVLAGRLGAMNHKFAEMMENPGQNRTEELADFRKKLMQDWSF